MVKFIKFETGEEVISIVQLESVATISLVNPASVHGDKMTYFERWCFCSGKTCFTVPRNSIILEIEVSAEVKEKYLKWL
ncbi:MAG: hypothetical protein R8M45_03720 [Ghiorsea sp.]